MSIECKKSSFCKSFVVIYAMLLFSQQSMANTFYFGLDCHKPLFEWTGPVTVKESGAVETNYTFDARNLAVLINIDTKKITNDNSISILHPHFYSARLGHQSKINNTVSYMVELEGISYQSNSTYSTYRVNHIDTPDMQTNIHNLSGIVNAYFSWQLNSFSLINPYIGAGVGAVYIHMFKESYLKPTYQLKLGVSFQVPKNKNIDMYIGARHVGIIGGKFNCKLDKVRRTYQRCFVDRVTRPVEEKEIKEEIEIQNSFFGTLGAEFGLVFHFKQNVENT